jgi:hypothetical protein
VKLRLNTPRYKGDYDLDIAEEPLTNLEWRWVKKISGYMPMTIDQGWEGADPDLFVAFAVIALARSGKVNRAEALEVARALDDLPFGEGVTFAVSEVEAEDPPEVPAETPATETQNGSTGSSSSKTSEPSPAPDRRTSGVPG